MLLWLAGLVLVFLVSMNLSARGQCEYASHPDGTWLPLGYPLQAETTVGRVALMRFISAMGMIESLAGALILMLLVGILWAHALRVAWPLLLVLLAPALALLLQLPEMAMFLLRAEWEVDPPLSMELAWEAEYWSRPFTQASYLLIGVGVVALGLRELARRYTAPPA